MSEHRTIEVFFDGDCPLCRREISMLRRHDRAHRIHFTDLTTLTDAELADGPDRATRMARIHARAEDGAWITGVEVLRRLYEAIGWRRAVAWTRARPVDAVLSRAYDLFAKNRLRITGRSHACDTGSCAIPARP